MTGVRSLMGSLVALAACAYDRPPLTDPDAVPGDRDGADAIDAVALDATRADAPALDAGPGPDAAATCARDTDCASGVCEGQACVAAGGVRYVATTGSDTAPCTQAAPCLTIARAIARHGTPAIVAVAPGTYPASVEVNPPSQGEPPFDLLIVGQTSGGGVARIRATSDGSNRDGVEVSRGAVRLRNLVVEGSPTNTSSDAIWTASGTTVGLDGVTVGPSLNDGIECNGCALTAVRSLFTGNREQGVQLQGGTATIVASRLEANQGGGAVLTGSACAITSSVIAGNGGSASAVGGVSLQCATLRFDNNTLASNAASADVGSALICGGASTPAGARNNLFDTPARALAGCTATYSLFSSGPLPPGAGNVLGAPRFVASNDLHIQPDSAARGAGDPATPGSPSVDLDGEPRVQGAPDIGADEIP